MKLQGVCTSPDLKYANIIVLTEQVKDAGAKTIQLGKLKDWCATQAQVLPAVVEVAPAAAEPAVEEPSTKKKRPKPKARRERSSSNNDVIETAVVEDPMEKALLSRFGAYRDSIQSFLMTQVLPISFLSPLFYVRSMSHVTCF